VPSRGPQAVAPIAHVVKPGETLISIAMKYGVSVNSLKRANNLKHKALLRVGSRLVIPVSANKEVRHSKASRSARAIVQPSHSKRAQKFHIVRRGESLGHIAEKYLVTVAELQSRNRIASGSKLFVGVKLLIPNARAASSARE
jgi:N-acetylmuramoyl-L-alanine amidase